MSDPFKEIREAANGAFDYINADDYVRWARGSMSDEEERIFDDLMRVVEHRNALRVQLKNYKEALAEATSCLIDFTELRCAFKGDEENVSNLAIRTMRFFRLLDQKGIDVFENKHDLD